jgi:hypothetical protein
MKKNKGLFLNGPNEELDLKLFDFLFVHQSSKFLIQSFFFIILLNLSNYSFSQNSDSTKALSNFGGAVTVTSNGISFIPTFSLGKPAAIFDLAMGRKRISFEPQFRFSLEGKPWSFFFWWRYKLIKTPKVAVTLGAHPAYAFKTVTTTTDGVSQEILRVQRYVAGELSPNYFLAKNISVGMYYLYSHGIDKDAVQNTHFLTFNCKFYDIKLPKQFYMKFIPQVYYLKMDQQDGFYFTSALTLANRKIPISVTGVINKIIQTEITASKNFVWNVSLVYSFNKKYREMYH